MGKKVRPWKSIRPPLFPETAETANATEHTPQPESNSRKVKIAVVALASGVAVVGIAVAFSLGGNKTTTPSQEPKVEVAVHDADTDYADEDVVEETDESVDDDSTAEDGPFDDPFANEFMELYVTPRLKEGGTTISSNSEEVEEYDDSLTVDKILDALEYNSLTSAINDDPERVAGYIRRWMVDNGYPSSVGGDVNYTSSPSITVNAPYGIGDINGYIFIDSLINQNLVNIHISNLTDPSDPQYYEYQSNEIPNYDALLQIAQEHLG